MWGWAWGVGVEWSVTVGLDSQINSLEWGQGKYQILKVQRKFLKTPVLEICFHYFWFNHSCANTFLVASKFDFLMF